MSLDEQRRQSEARWYEEQRRLEMERADASRRMAEEESIRREENSVLERERELMERFRKVAEARIRNLMLSASSRGDFDYYQKYIEPALEYYGAGEDRISQARLNAYQQAQKFAESERKKKMREEEELRSRSSKGSEYINPQSGLQSLVSRGFYQTPYAYQNV